MAEAKQLGSLDILSGTEKAGQWDQPDPLVTGLSVDSRTIQRGDLFAALPGSRLHGGTFIPYALRMGAAAILTDRAGLELAEGEVGPLPLPVVLADEPRQALAQAAARWFEDQPRVIAAVTGTNGKTSVASFLRQIWEANGKRAVNFGTTGVEGAMAAPLSHTTPEPITLHRLLAELDAEEVSHAAMEASSHGLEQRRLDGVRLAVAGFTNLSRDHLDYHPDFNSYFTAKSGLFTRVLPPEGGAVINIDDPHGVKLVELARSRGQEVLTVGREGDLAIKGSRFDPTGQNVLFSYSGKNHDIRLDLIGDFQAENALVAAGMAILTDIEPDLAFNALQNLRAVKGRMELAATRASGGVAFVDYAHTPDALETALKALRPHVMGRIIVVFGAGGDRDPGKRVLMGQAAAEFADVAFVTDDNPRTEDPVSIRKMVLEGCPEATEIGDRAEAILAGVDALQPGDACLIAGKGHENGQIVGQDVLPFLDAEQASIAAAALDGLER